MEPLENLFPDLLIWRVVPDANSTQGQVPSSAVGAPPAALGWQRPTLQPAVPLLPMLGLPVPPLRSATNAAPGVPAGSPCTASTPAPAVRRKSSLAYKKLRHRRRVQLGSRATAPKTLAGFASEIARQIRVYCNGDREVQEKVIRQVKATLSPRKPRKAYGATLKAAELLMAGQNWPSIYRDVLGDRWQYQKGAREKLNRNAKHHVKGLMRRDGAPAGMGIPDWIKQRRVSHSQMPLVAPPMPSFSKGTSTGIE